jgi:hypothetical protein
MTATVDRGFGETYTQENDAGVTQLVEYLLPKQAVAGSSPVPRSTKTDEIMLKSRALHQKVPSLFSYLGPVWVRTMENPTARSGSPADE